MTSPRGRLQLAAPLASALLALAGGCSGDGDDGGPVWSFDATPQVDANGTVDGAIAPDDAAGPVADADADAPPADDAMPGQLDADTDAGGPTDADEEVGSDAADATDATDATDAADAADAGEAADLFQPPVDVPPADPCEGASCSDGDPCTEDACDSTTGTCTHAAIDGCEHCATTADCDDEDPCTKDTCAADGLCAHSPNPCDDVNPCTVDGCSPATGCTHAPDPCDDGDACTDDACDPGTGCQHAAANCDDADPCTVDGCDPSSGCVSLTVTCQGGAACLPSAPCTCTADAECDDGAQCTDDACDPGSGVCVYELGGPDGSACDDGDPCTVGDTCEAGGCAAVAVDCDDVNPCTQDACSGVTGACLHLDAPLQGLPCDDGDPCTADDACAFGVCGGSPLPCDDADPCTTDSCGAGGCAHAPIDCDDGDACTLDVCTPSGDCGHDAAAQDGAACDDGIPCTVGDACLSGYCEGLPADCDDGDPCTLDACDDATGGCLHAEQEGCGLNHPCVPSSHPGSSDDAVTACVCAAAPECCSMAWSAGCVAVAELQCGVPCSGCEDLPPGAAPCAEDADCALVCGDDGDACNGGWACEAGGCVLLPPIVCPATGAGACTTTSCHPDSGSCQPSLVPGACDDQDPCTVDVCEPATGDCAHAPVPGCLDCAAGPAVSCLSDDDCAACDDGDLCDGGWGCDGGTCTPTPPVTCPPGELESCIAPGCEPTTGQCVPQPDHAACDDDDACTADECDVESGACAHAPLPGCLGNSPCKPAPTPGSNDATVSACVCDLMPACCEQAWSGGCVMVAMESCAVACTCGSLPLGDLQCASDGECGFCGDDLDACNGGWACVDGLCSPFEPTSCEDPGGCLVGTCDPLTGGCLSLPDAAACDDGDPCTTDVCVASSGECDYVALRGCSGDPCSSLVCQDASQCDDACGGDGDPCSGGWICAAAACVAAPPIECDTSADVGCLVTDCQPTTGQCLQAPVHQACDDGAPCTLDACEADGTCAHLDGPPGCGENPPCQVAPTPGSADAGVTACVCAVESYCCQVYWDAGCVAVADQQCGAACP